MDEDYFEPFCTDLRHLSKRFSAPDRTQILLWMYEVMPCSYCRTDVVKKLMEDGALPQAFLEEIVDDCEEDTRKLANTKAGD